MSTDTNLNTGESTKDGVKLYELAFNLITQVGDEGAVTEAENIKKIVENTEGKIVSESKPALIPLSYTMVKRQDTKKEKYNNAYFGWFKFEGSADSILSIKEELDLNTNILRYMITNTVKETDTQASTLAEVKSRKFEDAEDVVKEEVEVDVDATEDEAIELDEQEVDEAIDDLVKGDK